MQHSINVQRGVVVHTPEKVAERLDVKVSYVKRLLREGSLKGIKMGKFWRVTQESLDAFIARFDQGDQVNKSVSKGTLSKMRYQGALKSKNAAPGSIEKMTENIGKIKAELPAQEHFEKIPSIDKLKSTVLQREERKQKLETLPDFLDALSEQAYPGARGLVNEDPETLEAMFMNETQTPVGADHAAKEHPSMLEFAREQLETASEKQPSKTMKVGEDS